MIQFNDDQILNTEQCREGLNLWVKVPFTTDDWSWLIGQEFKSSDSLYIIEDAIFHLAEEATPDAGQYGEHVFIRGQLSVKQKLLNRLDERVGKVAGPVILAAARESLLTFIEDLSTILEESQRNEQLGLAHHVEKRTRKMKQDEIGVY